MRPPTPPPEPSLPPKVARGIGVGCAMLIILGVTLFAVAFLIWVLRVLL